MQILKSLFIIVWFVQIGILLNAQPANSIVKIDGKGDEFITAQSILNNNDKVIVGKYNKNIGATIHDAFQKNVRLEEEHIFPENVGKQEMFLNNIFIAKYKANGVLDWVIHSEGENDAHIYDMVTDSKDAIIITGTFTGNLHLPSLDKEKTILKGSTRIDFIANGANFLTYTYFIAKYTSSGKLLWYKTAFADESNGAKYIKVDRKDNIYVNVYCKANGIMFGDIIALSKPTLLYFSMLFVKYNPSGKEEWVCYGQADVNDFKISNDDKISFLCNSNEPFEIYNSNGYHYKVEKSFDKTFFIVHINTNGEVVLLEDVFAKTKGLKPVKYVNDDSANYYVLFEMKRFEYNEDKKVQIGKTIIPITEDDPNDGDVYLIKFSKKHEPLWYVAFNGEHIDNPINIALDVQQNPVVLSYHLALLKIKDGTGKDTSFFNNKKSIYITHFTKDGAVVSFTAIADLLARYNTPEYYSQISISKNNELLLSTTTYQPVKVFDQKITNVGKPGYWPYYDTINGTPGIYYTADSYFTSYFILPESSKPVTNNDPAIVKHTAIQKNKSYKNDQNIKLLKDIVVYPNPITASQKMVYYIVESENNENYTLHLIDSKGTVLFIRQEKVTNGTNKNTINLLPYAAGIYYINFIFKNQTVSKKLIIL